MENTILDSEIAGATPQRDIAPVGRRLVATLLDGLIFAAISLVNVGVTYLFDSSYLTIFFTMVTLAYKPAMEYVYGATFGKQWMKMRVVNADYGKAGVGAILLRNIFTIGFTAVSLLVYATSMFYTGMYDTLGGTFYQVQRFTPWARGGIFIIDFIFLMTDNTLHRALHDRIGGTLVVDDEVLPQPIPADGQHS